MVGLIQIDQASIRHLRSVRTKVRRAGRSVSTAGPAFRQMDREIDQLIRENFANLEGGGVSWDELSTWTEFARFREEGWYAHPPTADAIGRWTQTMYHGLLGRGVNGEKVITPELYERRYLGEENEGPNTGLRAQIFHEGHGGEHPQPARPFWGDRERTGIAVRVLQTYYRGIAGRFE